MVGAIGTNSGYVDSNQKLYLERYLQEVQNEQGFLGNIFNGAKEFFDVGLSESDCESMVEDFKNGKISFEEAVSCIEKFEAGQEKAAGLMSNIITGVGAIAVATTAAASGPIGWALAFAKGAPIGAAIKTGVNLLDRATNNVEGDEFDAKVIAKDAISGALTGATSAVSSGVGTGIRNAQFGTSVLNGVKCGAACGSMSGAATYMTDVAFGDTEYDTKDLITNTLVSGASSALVGGVVGGTMYGGASMLGTAGKEVTKTTATRVAQDSISSSARKVAGSYVKPLLEDIAQVA